MNISQMTGERGTRAGRIFDLVIQSLIIFSLVSFCIETLPDLRPRTRIILAYLETITVVIFSVEYVLRVYAAGNKLGFIFSFYGIVDLLAVAPFYVAAGIDLRSIRIVRLFRLIRAFKLFRYSRAIRRLQRALTIIREELIIFFISALFLIFIASLGIYSSSVTRSLKTLNQFFTLSGGQLSLSRQWGMAMSIP